MNSLYNCLFGLLHRWLGEWMAMLWAKNGEKEDLQVNQMRQFGGLVVWSIIIQFLIKGNNYHIDVNCAAHVLVSYQ